MAKRRVDVPADRVAALSAGTASSADLVEHLVVDQVALARAVFPALGAPLPPAVDALGALPLKGRLAAFADALLAAGPRALAAASAHPSDTVRSWAALAYREGLPPAERLAKLLPFARDAHFGVREYAWMAYRGALVEDFTAAAAPLLPLVTDDDENVRRFAAEVTRPRGVWCPHLRALRDDPRPGLPLLEPLRADRSRYVRLSVANWLNDAGKDHPDLIAALAARWREESPGAETAHIVRHGTRGLASTPRGGKLLRR